MSHALGEYTIFVPHTLTPNGGAKLAHPVQEGTALALMEAIEDEVAAAGKDTLQSALMQSGITEPAAILVCSCFLRMNLLKSRINEELAAITTAMPGVPLAGFYSAGEQGTNADHVSRHNNEAIDPPLGNELSYAAQVAEENRILYRMLDGAPGGENSFARGIGGTDPFLQILIENIPNPVFYKDHRDYPRSTRLSRNISICGGKRSWVHPSRISIRSIRSTFIAIGHRVDSEGRQGRYDHDPRRRRHPLHTSSIKPFSQSRRDSGRIVAA